MSRLFAEAGGGAPIDQLAIVAAGTWGMMALTLLTVVRYRQGGAPRLRRVEATLERRTGLPGWAAVPGLGAVLCAAVTIVGATWDIGLHIDLGRDEGPLGTAAHYPLLFGLFGAFLMGILALGLAPEDPRRSSSVAFRISGVGAVPAAGVLLLAGASFGMLAFPLDDVWHRIFGQDVTLWGPTHVMIIGGTLSYGLGAVLLLVEGARAAGKEPFRGRGGLLRRPLPLLLVTVSLMAWTAITHEFNWGVPQYRLIWHPLLLAFGAAQALVLARLLAGRGGALGAVAIYLPLQAGMSVLIGGPLEVTMPAFPLFVAEALVVEALALRGDPRRPLAFGLGAGVAVGTLGFAAEYGWSHLFIPLPWPSTFLAEAIPVAVVAAAAGGTLAALMAQALTGTLPRGRTGLAAALVAAAAFVGLAVNAAVIAGPADVRATIAVADVRPGATPNHDEPQEVADLTVRFSDPAIADDPTWVYAMAWQGGGRYEAPLERGPDGAWRSTEPVPVGGTWKTLVRVHRGRTMLSVPVRYRPDPEIGFPGIPLRAEATRAMVPDTDIMQLERKDDAPMWAWLPATILVLSTNLVIAAFIGVVCVRLGRMSGGWRPRWAGAPGQQREEARDAVDEAGDREAGLGQRDPGELLAHRQ